jgi:hypothetical protein
MNRRCAHCWLYWLVTCAASFTYLELRGYLRHCHPTLSRELQLWTGYRPRKPYGRWTPFLFAGLGSWLTWHLIRLQELEEST